MDLSPFVLIGSRWFEFTCVRNQVLWNPERLGVVRACVCVSRGGGVVWGWREGEFRVAKFQIECDLIVSCGLNNIFRLGLG